jgi:DNA helicase-2/ATP-dependent DNA helicase PcrA
LSASRRYGDPVQFVADLHIHSKHSRATSKDCDLENLAWWAARKGISVVGTGDFTHPIWFDELKEKLVPAEPGLFRLMPEIEAGVLARLPASCRRPVRFSLSVEISTIYKRDDRTRKVHHLIYMPDFDSAAGFNAKLDSIGNIRSDGRPILGLDSRHLLEIVLEFGGYLVPAHIWTPWFAVLGSQSGFDHVDHCYADLASHVFAVETGLSSDPQMNWRVSSLDRFQLVSNSDAHSPPALGREATVFDTDMNYFAIKSALETGAGLAGTLEFFPDEGKYHLDGHRKCGVVWEPNETQRHHGICNVCGKPVTVGVSHRVDVLADRELVEAAPSRPPFRSLVALPEIVGEILGVGPKSKRVVQNVTQLAERLGPELDILQHIPVDDIEAVSSPLLAEAIRRLRSGNVLRRGGFDGEYGVIRMFEPGEIQRRSVVDVLFEMPAEERSRDHSRPDHVIDAREIDTDDVDGLNGESGLNTEQLAAIHATTGPVLVVAGPGTGKTRVLVERFAHLIENEGVDAGACLAITFTRRAADELRERLIRATPFGRSVTVTTFHGLGLQILQRHPEAAGLTSDFRVANSFETVDKAVDWPRSTVDFDDLLQLPVQVLSRNDEIGVAWRHRFEHIAVDEYQDVDPTQYELLRLLTTDTPNLCAVGDPDQSIYGFRGADVGIFLRFEQDFPLAQRITLVNNYRSSAAILRGSASAVRPSSLVADRTLRPMRRDRSADFVTIYEASTDTDEAHFVARTTEQLLGGTSLYSFDSGRAGHSEFHLSFSDIAVLYRTDAQAKVIQNAFHQAGIPAQKRSHNKLLDHPGVSELAAFLSEHRCDTPSFDACLMHFADVQPSADTADLSELLAPLYERCNGDRTMLLSELALGAEIDAWDPRADRVSLLTLHASKGLEFPVVFIVGVNDNLLPLRFGGTTNWDEERRLLFVGMTRAQSHLFLTHARARPARGGNDRKAALPSPFLSDIDSRVVDRQMASALETRQLRLL